MQTSTAIRIFVASPSDVKAERDEAVKVIREWNAANSYARKVILEAVAFEKHVASQQGSHPQDIINRQLLDRCDLLIAIFWSKVGSPTLSAASGTIQEIKEFAQRAGGDRVAVFFSDRRIEKTTDLDDLKQIQDYQRERQSQGVYKSFKNTKDFGRQIRHELDLMLNLLLKSETAEAKHQEPPTSLEIAVWKPEPPTSNVVLGDSVTSLLFMGISHKQIVDGDYHDYKEWLEQDENRRLGLLFLNPHSPHMYPRGRKFVDRSTREAVADAIQLACRRRDEDRVNITPLVYDGPYRYSARLVDFGTETPTDEECVDIITSSHRGGISRGFKIHCSPKSTSGAYAYYRGDVLEVWRKALANPAGHGISLVSRWSIPTAQNGGVLEDRIIERVNTLTDAAKTLLQGRMDFELLGLDQLHVTIASLRRTQKFMWSEPLRIVDDSDDDCYVPPDVCKLLTRADELFQRIVTAKLSFTFDKIFVTERGNIILGCSETDGLTSMIDEFIQEWWRVVVNRDARLQPKRHAGQDIPTFMPHMTIGSVFAIDAGFPVLINGSTATAVLEKPIQFEGNPVSIVHYAYRSLLRCVGELQIGFGEMKASSIGERLGIVGDDRWYSIPPIDRIWSILQQR